MNIECKTEKCGSNYSLVDSISCPKCGMVDIMNNQIMTERAQQLRKILGLGEKEFKICYFEWKSVKGLCTPTTNDLSEKFSPRTDKLTSEQMNRKQKIGKDLFVVYFDMLDDPMYFEEKNELRNDIEDCNLTLI